MQAAAEATVAAASAAGVGTVRVEGPPGKGLGKDMSAAAAAAAAGGSGYIKPDVVRLATVRLACLLWAVGMTLWRCGSVGCGHISVALRAVGVSLCLCGTCAHGARRVRQGHARSSCMQARGRHVWCVGWRGCRRANCLVRAEEERQWKRQAQGAQGQIGLHACPEVTPEHQGCMEKSPNPRIGRSWFGTSRMWGLSGPMRWEGVLQRPWIDSEKV